MGVGSHIFVGNERIEPLVPERVSQVDRILFESTVLDFVCPIVIKRIALCAIRIQN